MWKTIKSPWSDHLHCVGSSHCHWLDAWHKEPPACWFLVVAPCQIGVTHKLRRHKAGVILSVWDVFVLCWFIRGTGGGGGGISRLPLGRYTVDVIIYKLVTDQSSQQRRQTAQHVGTLQRQVNKWNHRWAHNGLTHKHNESWRSSCVSILQPNLEVFFREEPPVEGDPADYDGSVQSVRTKTWSYISCVKRTLCFIILAVYWTEADKCSDWAICCTEKSEACFQRNAPCESTQREKQGSPDLITAAN